MTRENLHGMAVGEDLVCGGGFGFAWLLGVAEFSIKPTPRRAGSSFCYTGQGSWIGPGQVGFVNQGNCSGEREVSRVVGQGGQRESHLPSV
jgi:hypothetical protein